MEELIAKAVRWNNVMIDIVLRILLIANGQAGVIVPRVVEMEPKPGPLFKKPNMEEEIAKEKEPNIALMSTVQLTANCLTGVHVLRPVEMV